MTDGDAGDIAALKRRMVLIFALTAAAISAAGGLYYRHYQAVQVGDAQALLSAIFRFKQEQIAFWRQDRLKDASSLLDSPVLSQYLERFEADHGDKALAALLKKRLEAFIKYNSYRAAMLADADGHILINAGEAITQPCPEARRLLPGINADPVMSDLILSPDEVKPHISILARASSGRRGAKLYLILRADPEDYLYPLVGRWPTNSASGEALLVRKNNDDVLFLTRLRMRQDKPMTFRMPLLNSLPAAMALKGGYGAVSGADYRGKKVLAWVGMVPDTNWGLVVKMDQAELFASGRRISALLLLAILALTGAAGIGAFLVFRTQSAGMARKLSQSEDKFRLFFENSPLGKSITGLDGSVHANRALCAMLGYTEAELRGKRWQDLTPPEDIKFTEEAIKSLLDGERSSIQFEKRFIRKDGRVVNAELTSALQRDAAGRPEYMLTTINDITERRKAARALAQSEKRFRAIIEASPVPYAVNDNRQNITFLNSAFTATFGYSQAELRTLSDWWPRAYPDPAYRKWVADSWQERLERMTREGHFEPLEVNILAKNGEMRSVISMAANLPDSEEHLVILYDITERKRAEDALARTAANLESKNKELEEFLYIASHDLRGPMVNIQGFSRNIQKYCAEIGKTVPRGAEAETLLKEKLPEALGFLLGSAARMDGLINSLLKVSRLGRVEINIQTVDMDKLVSDLRTSMAFQINEAGARIQAGPLPHCLGDATLLSQVFSNLLDNAIKYRSPDRAPEVEISGGLTGADTAEYRIADNGLGISDEEAAGKIWTLFYRADPAGTVKGEGLGLTAAKRIIERHGGSIAAARRAGGGTEFTIRLKAWRQP